MQREALLSHCWIGPDAVSRVSCACLIVGIIVTSTACAEASQLDRNQCLIGGQLHRPGTRTHTGRRCLLPTAGGSRGCGRWPTAGRWGRNAGDLFDGRGDRFRLGDQPGPGGERAVDEGGVAPGGEQLLAGLFGRELLPVHRAAGGLAGRLRLKDAVTFAASV
jgi:hypothetical protein